VEIAAGDYKTINNSYSYKVDAIGINMVCTLNFTIWQCQLSSTNVWIQAFMSQLVERS